MPNSSKGDFFSSSAEARAAASATKTAAVRILNVCGSGSALVVSDRELPAGDLAARQDNNIRGTRAAMAVVEEISLLAGML